MDGRSIQHGTAVEFCVATERSKNLCSVIFRNELIILPFYWNKKFSILMLIYLKYIRKTCFGQGLSHLNIYEKKYLPFCECFSRILLCYKYSTQVFLHKLDLQCKKEEFIEMLLTSYLTFVHFKLIVFLDDS